MRALFTVLILFFCLQLPAQKTPMSSIHDFKVKTIDGKEFDLSSLKGKKVMIVNTASECGYTPQYAELEELYKKYSGGNFTIIGFPSNDFGAQEPGSNEQIKEFCKKNYGVTFPMMEKIVVKGDQAHPLYQYLTKKEFNGVMDSEVKWNFQKYLIDEKGHVTEIIKHSMSPMDPKVISWIETK